MEWISVDIEIPEFNTPVLMYCKIYGRYIGWYQQIEGECGNWHDGNVLGVLPPTHWMPLPEPPKSIEV